MNTNDNDNDRRPRALSETPPAEPPARPHRLKHDMPYYSIPYYATVNYNIL